MASWERFLWAMSWLQFRSNLVVNLALISLLNSHDFRDDWATIAPRSGVDRACDSQQKPSDDRGFDSTTKDPRSRLDRAAIAVRSGCDRGVLPRSFPAVRWSFNWMDGRDPPVQCTTIVRRVHRQPSDW